MIIIDVEIKKAILGRNEQPLPGIEYCEGWRDFQGMGISCVCTYDIVSHLSRTFFEAELGDLALYVQDKVTAGFNTKRFDLPLLREHGVDVDFGPSTRGAHYDMLEAIWVALGLDPDKFNPRTHGGWGLDAVADATLGIRKTGNGALAPVWWQKGLRGKVVDYCLNDVWMEGQLLLHILKHGWVRVPDDKLTDVGVSKLPVARPAGMRYVYEASPITGPRTALEPAKPGTPEYCAESRYDVGNWHSPGSNGFCRDCGQPNLRETTPIDEPQDNLQDVRRMASAGGPLIDLDKPRATGSGEAVPVIGIDPAVDPPTVVTASPGGLGIIR